MRAEYVVGGFAVLALLAGIIYAKTRESEKAWSHSIDGDVPDRRVHGSRASPRLKRAVPVRLGSPGECVAQANDLFGKGRGSEAQDILDRAISQYPNDATLHATLGALLHKRCCPEDALKSFERTIELDPKAADAHAGRGHILFSFALYDKAYDSPVRYEEVYASLARARAFGCNDAKMHHYIGLTLEFLARQHARSSIVLRLLAIKSLQRVPDTYREYFDVQSSLEHIKNRLK